MTYIILVKNPREDGRGVIRKGDGVKRSFKKFHQIVRVTNVLFEKRNFAKK
jgi:hypothetical protein